MAVCRARLWGMQGVVRAEGLVCVCVWVDRWMNEGTYGIDGVMEGEGSVVSSWSLLRPLIKAAKVCSKW